ncbi:probable serine/threonine-protein kinase MARK-A [Toxorhynchites rutilus septentrionalis]|uniref:probable serine/threonine-protein kinase MARK-A n=1 Tax=Toxorhynchites rutilus septentrionalis TaxID=329112 RepID=UPI002479411C|nr:probable serine/threonine-protein kinase MARK-A [Toxorhynchites rutilus septentrionalis]
MEQARVHTKGKHRSSRSRSTSRRACSSNEQRRTEQEQTSNNTNEDDEVVKNRAPSVSSRHSRHEENADSGGTTGNASSKTNNNNNNNNEDDAIDNNQNPPDNPVETTSLETVPGTDDKLQKGILGYMDRQLKVQSLSDPQKSPAQRSTRSRCSLEKSPRRKRSKSESRRRRERKIIAAGEMEVRQANETLMRYLKQCSDFNDASLSGDLEIPENLEDRRVHRKTKSQRERKYQQQNANKPTGDDSAHYNGEIYNPFTPVVSPTAETAPTRIDKMYIQTASGYRPVDNIYHHHHHHHSHFRHLQSAVGRDPESNNYSISTGVQLSCAVQRIWLHVSNVCHGLLGGLALAHLLLICTTKPYDWVEASIRHYSAFAEVYANTFYCLAIICMVSIFDRMDIAHFSLSSTAENNISFRSVIIIMIYAATIILSLSAGSMDERLYLSTSNITVWEEEMETNKVLSIWNTLSIARSVGAVFGWVVIGISPEQDQLYEHLYEMERYQIQ